jgi:hypothetical protein
MQGTELFLSLAEIAGVFVGFGALIAVRSGGAMQAGEITDVRWVVTTAIWVVIAGLAPIVVSTYGLVGHGLWLGCSLLALAFLIVMTAVFSLTPENRSELADNLATTPRALIVAVMVPTFWVPFVLIIIALVAVVLGLFPDQEHALYLTAVALGLLMSALMLFVGVFWLPATEEGLKVPSGARRSGLRRRGPDVRDRGPGGHGDRPAGPGLVLTGLQHHQRPRGRLGRRSGQRLSRQAHAQRLEERRAAVVLRVPSGPHVGLGACAGGGRVDVVKVVVD